MHFGEYELSPSLISLSPLPSSHPKTFQRLPVRSSMLCYQNFNLLKGRSLGFASTPADYAHNVRFPLTGETRPVQTRFRSGSAP